jgi:glycogen debranching enzyme
MNISKMFFLSVAIITGYLHADTQERGVYFSKKNYTPEPLPVFAEIRHQLPSPVLDGDDGWIDMYWKCWEIAFRGLKSPQKGSPFVSNWLDEAFSENIFQWDTIFMMMFARYGHSVFPAIQSLDNFYCMQKKCGYICREIKEVDGTFIHYDHEGGLFAPTGWKNTINPPLFSWAEVESYRLTGDKSRFAMVLPVLEKYAEWLNRDGDPDAEDWQNNGRISRTAKHSLYWNTPLGSGMDNSPRPAKKGAGWVEMSAQMVIMYNHCAIMADELGKTEKARFFETEAKKIGDRINKWCWNEKDAFYYDVLADGTQFEKKTMGGFWPLLAGIASKEQAAGLVGHLKNEKEFWRVNVFPTLSADEPEYNPLGDYWLGGVWAPTNVMIIKGLEHYGYDAFAAEATEKYLAALYKTFVDSGTVYENYAPDFLRPGGGYSGSRSDFVGWTGCGPIQLLFENVMGLRAEGINHRLSWHLRRTDRHGVEKLRVGDATLTLLCEKRKSSTDAAVVKLLSDKNFQVTLYGAGKKKNVKLKPDVAVTVSVK